MAPFILYQPVYEPGIKTRFCSIFWQLFRHPGTVGPCPLYSDITARSAWRTTSPQPDTVDPCPLYSDITARTAWRTISPQPDTVDPCPVYSDI
jgi:hypothetical protein